MRILVKISLIVLWTLMALVLLVAASLICAVRILEPARLTPLVTALANRTLDARVDIGRVELAFRPAFPMLHLQVDSLTIVSHAFDSLPDASRRDLPVWADTLLVVDSFRGGVNLGLLASRGEIALRNVEIVRPGLNIVLDASGRGNFDIYSSAPDTVAAAPAATGGPVVLPSFSIDRFAFVEPREIRYFNALDSTEATVLLLAEAGIDGSKHPTYNVKIDGRIDSPVARMLVNLDDISFGLDGRVHWSPDMPRVVSVEEFKVRGAFFSAKVDATVDIDSVLTVSDAALAVDPVSIEDALTLLPDSLRRANRLCSPWFSTDATVSLGARLTAPFRLGPDTIPCADITIAMPDARLRYGAANFRQLGFDIDAHLHGNNPDSIVVDVRRFEIAGPATHLAVSGTATNLVADPAFDLTVEGDIEMAQLPPVVADLARGFINGRLDADLRARGRLSELDQTSFHKLDVAGNLTGHRLYYLSNDTAKMAEVHRVVFNFGSRRRFDRPDSTAGKTVPLLAADISVDTATVLVDGVSITLADLALGIAAENSSRLLDTTIVTPLGGGLKIGRLNIESVTDSAGARMRNLVGRVGLRRYKDHGRLPEITADLELGRVAAGSLSSRLVLSKAKLHAAMHKLPGRNSKARREMKALVDSLSRRHPELAPDSVYKLAIAKRRHRPGQHRRPRVHTQMMDDDAEILEWGLSKGFSRFLLGWHLDGALTARNARLFTPVFPLRNRIRHLDLGFSTDSVVLRGVTYRAGRSDLAITGIISNIKRGLTATPTRPASLKVNFNIASDTIDVNQLAAAVFAGAAYSERIRSGRQEAMSLSTEGSESDLDRDLDALASEHPDTVGPLLIPTNLDASLHVKAKNIMYSDLLMTDLSGDVLMFGGGVNLHDLKASSDAGSLNLSALYSAPKATDMKFGFGLDLTGFHIERFLTLVPAIDSIMPLMRDFSGIIDAEIAATVDIDSTMNMELPTLDAAVRLTGDSLALIDPDTYRTLGKWLRFKDKTDNTIKHMNVELLVKDNVMQLFPFTFDIDRYRLGVVGSNDLALNFDYHIAVLKSPLPFKFGITLKGNPEHYKVRFGGAKFKEGMAAERVNVVDTVRVNLIDQIEKVFRRGVNHSRFARLNVSVPADIRNIDNGVDPGLSAADSLALIKEGLIEAPVAPAIDTEDENKSEKRSRGLFRKNRK